MGQGRHRGHIDVYHSWFNLTPGESDLEFVGHMETFLDGMTQIDAAFNLMSERGEPPESKHFTISRRVTDV